MNRGDALRVVAIVASTREGRFAPVIARWFVEECAAREEFHVELLDLAEVKLPEALSRSADAGVEALRRQLEGADAFVILTPEYNHSFPAPLKAAIDWSAGEWAAKPVAFVSYGGVSGGLRAVEQLRQIVVELHATSIRNSVSFNMVWEHFDGSGQSRHAERHHKSAMAMLDQLRWWAWHLKRARAEEPYTG